MIYFAIVFFLACIYVGWGYTIVGQNQAAVVERFGKFNRVIFPGWHILCFPGIIDRLTESKNQHKKFIPIGQAFPVQVFEASEQIDLSNDTVGIDIFVWVQVGIPGDLDEGSIAGEVRKYVYTQEDAKKYLGALVTDRIRPIIQAMNLDEALKLNAETVLAAKARQELQEALKNVGLYLREPNVITVGDFRLSPQTVALREKILEAQKNRQAREEEALGFRKAAEILAKGVEKRDASGAIIPTPDSETITIREAVDTQNRLAALQALKGADLRLVQSTTGAALDAIMDLAGQQGGNQRPQGGNPRSNQRRNNPRNQT